MKKRKRLNLLKLGVFLFGFSLLLWSCEKEEINLSEKQTITSSYEIKNLTHKDLIEDKEIQQPLQFLENKFLKNKQNVQSKGTEELAEGLTILTENVHKITANNTITWTFKIDSKILEDSDFENFLVKKHNDKFSYFLVAYQLGKNEANNEAPYKKVSLYPISEEKLKLDNLYLAKGDSFDWVEPDSGGGTTEDSCEGEYAGTEFQTCNQGGYHTAGTYCCQHYDFSTGQDGPHGCDYMKNFMGCGNTCTGTKEVAIYDFSHCNNDLPDGPSNDLPEPEDGMVGGDVTGGGGGSDTGSSSGGGTVITSPVEDADGNTYTEAQIRANNINRTLDNSLSPSELHYLSDSNNLNLTIEVESFLFENTSPEAIFFIKQAIKLDLILDNNLEVKTTGNHPDEISDCCPGDCCPSPYIYNNDPIIQEYGIKPIQAAIDATFNALALISGVVGSKEWVGKRARRIMTEIGLTIPKDISDEQLGELFQIRKKDGLIIVEYREGFLKSMLSLGLDTLDILSFVSPSKGGGAFLAIKGGAITKTKLTEYLRVLAKGQWKTVSESMSDAAKSYQELISGRKWNESFVLNSVKFDGLRNGVLSDAKSGMLNFVNSDGTFKSFFTGKDAIVSQARRQRAAAGDLPIEWHFEHDNVRLAFEKLLTPLGLNIKFTHTRR